MPFRHLLFNRRNGTAPRRDLDQQSISLQEAANFSLEDEFPGYKDHEGWPDHIMTQSPTAYNMTMQRSTDHNNKGYWQQPNETFDPRAMFPYNSTNGVPYQNSPYDFDSSSLQYSSDMALDTDVSSVSRGSIHSSISSISHVDVVLEEDLDSLRSLSRKPSIVSSVNTHEESGVLCPLVTGQVGKCSPELCGPAAPCLQYNTDERVPPIEDCVTQHRSSVDVGLMDSNAIDFTHHGRSHHGPSQQVQQQAYSMPNVSVQQSTNAEMSSMTDTTISKSRSRQASASGGKSSATPTADESTAKPTKKVRARQAHSLVERKYRENLNSKIQELHQLLHRVQASRNGSRVSPMGLQIDEEDFDDDGTERSTSSRVKKSDVLVEAMSYVHTMEREMQRKDGEIQQLHDRISMMENWIKTGTIGQNIVMST